MAKYSVISSKRTGHGSVRFVAKSGVMVSVPLSGAEIETTEDLSEHVGVWLSSPAGATKKPAAVKPEPAPEPVRARTDEGHFKADDPATPENEAWEGGEAPKSSAKKKLAKAAAKRKKSED